MSCNFHGYRHPQTQKVPDILNFKVAFLRLYLSFLNAIIIQNITYFFSCLSLSDEIFYMDGIFAIVCVGIKIIPNRLRFCGYIEISNNSREAQILPILKLKINVEQV